MKIVNLKSLLNSNSVVFDEQSNSLYDCRTCEEVYLSEFTEKVTLVLDEKDAAKKKKLIDTLCTEVFVKSFPDDNGNRVWFLRKGRGPALG